MSANERRPRLNNSPEARALRQAALNFARQPEKPINAYGPLGAAANKTLLRAAIKYAAAVARSRP